MLHQTPLIATIAAGLGLAFVFGVVAHRLKAPPLVGYLIAGIMVGPFTPGYVADQALANELAEIGVILLMFGVGLHVSVKDLMSVRKIAIPGAVVQMGVATLLGMGLGHLFGWPLYAGFVFGLALSVASTVVLLRALQERRIVQTERGRIAVGWLIVEDIAMVAALVLLPLLAQAILGDGEGGAPSNLWLGLALALGKVGAFIAFMLIVGRRVIPFVLHYVAHTGSRELFRLAVLAIALGVAFGAAMLFDVSFALGAFFAGVILSESELSHQAAEDTLPLRDAFAVLFFVSIGMLFNPLILVQQPWAVLGTLAIIILGKSLAALAIMRAFRRDGQTSATVAASLAQIGEFSFILAGLGVSLKLLPPEGRDLILAGAILSIMVNPLVFTLAARWAGGGKVAAPAAPAAEPALGLVDHTVLVGFGSVGKVVAQGLAEAQAPFLVIENGEDALARAQAAGCRVVEGNAADPAVLRLAGLERASRLIVAIPNAFEAGQVVEQAHRIKPALAVLARAHTDAEAAHLKARGADLAVLDEAELGRGILDRALTASVAISPAAPPADPPRPILTDAEHAVLAGFRQIGAGPREAVSTATLEGHAAQSAIPLDALRAAIASLAAQDYLTDLRDGRLALTATGFTVSVR